MQQKLYEYGVPSPEHKHLVVIFSIDDDGWSFDASTVPHRGAADLSRVDFEYEIAELIKHERARYKSVEVEWEMKGIGDPQRMLEYLMDVISRPDFTSLPRLMEVFNGAG